MDSKLFWRIVRWGAAAFFVSVAIVFGLNRYRDHVMERIEPWEARAQFGDIWGGPNAFFSALAFCGVVFALILQRHEI